MTEFILILKMLMKLLSILNLILEITALLLK